MNAPTRTRKISDGSAAPLRVSRLQDGFSLQAFIAERLKLSNRGAKQLLDTRHVWVNRQCVWMAHHRLHAGDLISITGANASLAPERLTILAQDSDYCFVLKPAGLLTIGADSLESRLRRQCDEAGLRAVHRLDRETSGCVLMARSVAAFDAAVDVFKTRQVVKRYQAIVAGSFHLSASTVKAPIDGKRAVTHLRCLHRGADASHLSITIETGRTHQIRRHLATMRHPILGDREHGIRRQTDRRLQQVPRMMLHAVEMSLPHPIKEKEVLRAHAPLPSDFLRCLTVLGLSRAKNGTRTRH